MRKSIVWLVGVTVVLVRYMVPVRGYPAMPRRFLARAKFRLRLYRTIRIGNADLPHANRSLNLVLRVYRIRMIIRLIHYLIITHGTFLVKSPRARPRPRLVRGSFSRKASCFLGPAKLPRDGAGGGSSLERECPLSS